MNMRHLKMPSKGQQQEERLHSALSYKSPEQFEMEVASNTVA